MNDFLSSPVWQGIGVLIATTFSIISVLIGLRTRNKVFKSKNSKFESDDENVTEVLDGQIITLSGKVREELFPGPPNYESVNNGDTPQFYWLLYTNTSISIVSRCIETEKLIDHGHSCSFQLSLNQDFYDKRSDILGKYVRVTGEVFVGHTGHHKTKALLDVKNIEII